MFHIPGNSDIVNKSQDDKSPVIVLTKVNIKIKIDHAKFLLKSRCTKWISIETGITNYLKYEWISFTISITY